MQHPSIIARLIYVNHREQLEYKKALGLSDEGFEGLKQAVLNLFDENN